MKIHLGGAACELQQSHHIRMNSPPPFLEVLMWGTMTGPETEEEYGKFDSEERKQAVAAS